MDYSWLTATSLAGNPSWLQGPASPKIIPLLEGSLYQMNIKSGPLSQFGTTLKGQPLQNPTWNDWGLSWNLTGVSFSTAKPCLPYLPRGLYRITFCIQLSTLEPSCRELTLKLCLSEVPLSSNVIVPFAMCGSYTVYYLLKNPNHLFCRIFHVLDLADSIPMSSFILILSVNR